MQKNLLTFVDDIYEDLELWYPKLRLEAAGYGMVLAALEHKTFAGKHGYPARPDALIKEVNSTDYCGLMIPGGFMPDQLRRDPKVLAIVRACHERRRLLAAICHGGWIPISAGVYRGVRVTGSPGIKDDLVNAGALFEDAPVVVDRHFVSSRRPDDLPEFCRGLLQVLATQA